MIRKLILCFFALLLTSNIIAQKTITGTVNDSTGPLPGASVFEKELLTE